MGILSRLGKRHLELAGLWLGSASAFGGAAAVGLVYATDWKAILHYLPYYNGKFTEEK